MGDNKLVLWMQQHFNTLLTLERPPNPSLQDTHVALAPVFMGKASPGITEDDIQATLKGERSRKLERDEDLKGTRAMKPDDYRAYIGHAGLNPDTHKEESPPCVLAFGKGCPRLTEHVCHVHGAG